MHVYGRVSCPPRFERECRVNEIALCIGLGIFVIGAVGLLISAFRTSVLWGLAVLFIAPVAVIYLIVHWQDAKNPFKVQVCGLMVMAVVAYMNSGISSVTFLGTNAPGKAFFAPEDSGFPAANVPGGQQFRCDGRTHCSQMKSCAEATWFLRNCPNTKMDGNNDGVPCERQWCK